MKMDGEYMKVMGKK